MIVCFKGGKRLTSLYRYACVIEEVNEEEGECKVVSMKCMDNSHTNFVIVDTDVCFVSFEEVLGITQDPAICMKGERLFYKFPKALDVFEKC